MLIDMPPAAVSRPSLRHPANGHGPVKILMVDDQPANLLALEAILEDLGHTLVAAESGEQALKCLLRDDFAVILLDVFMPGMDGFETAQLIRQRDRSRATPIVFLTALGTSETHVFRGYSVGAVDYLLKPLVPEILRYKVAAFVDLYEKTCRVAQQAEQLRELERQYHQAELVKAQRQVEVARFQQEMRAARQVQQALFPRQAPSSPRLDIAGASFPAEATGGDYYDYIPSCDGCLDIVVGDVSGHGLSAALLMSSTRAYLRALALSNLPIDDVLATTNRALAADLEADRFVTLLYLRLSAQNLTLNYTSAGHPSAYVMSRDGDVSATLESTATPLGILADGHFPVGPQTQLLTGDTVLLLTDGVTEAMSSAGHQFGVDRAIDVLRVHRGSRASEVLQALHSAVQEFTEGAALEDDLTAVVIRVQ